MKRVNILYTLLTLSVVVLLVSCQKKQEVGGTAVEKLSAEWWVKVDDGNDPTGTFDNNWHTFATYNTSSNKADSMWVDDYENLKPFWQIKGKVATNAANLTFSGTNIVNQDYESTFTIKNGKVIPNAATAPGTKLKTDSIYFEIQFSDDPVPGTIHKVAGYARTKFDADDHY